MKKKYYSIFYLICIITVLVSGCSTNTSKADTSKADSPNKSSNNTKNQLTLDEIKQSYAKTDEKILSTQEYKDYLLVESQAPTLANRFTLYNLKTGDKDTLPSGAEFIDSAKIIDENNIILYTKGTSSESARQVFPYEIDCVRGVENNNSEGDFTPIHKDLELPVNKLISLKGKEKEEINDIRVTVNGLQVSFSPQSGSETSFYADYLDIPTTDISYDEKVGEFTLEFHDTTLVKTLSNTSALPYQNIFINSLKFKESDNSVVVIVKINKTSKYFIGKKSSIDTVENGISYLDIQFK